MERDRSKSRTRSTRNKSRGSTTPSVGDRPNHLPLSSKAAIRNDSPQKRKISREVSTPSPSMQRRKKEVNFDKSTTLIKLICHASDIGCDFPSNRTKWLIPERRGVLKSWICFLESLPGWKRLSKANFDGKASMPPSYQKGTSKNIRDSRATFFRNPH